MVVSRHDQAGDTAAGAAARYQRLRVLNLVVGVVHLAQAGVLLALSNDLSLPITGSFLRADPINIARSARGATTW